MKARETIGPLSARLTVLAEQSASAAAPQKSARGARPTPAPEPATPESPAGHAESLTEPEPKRRRLAEPAEEPGRSSPADSDKRVSTPLAAPAEVDADDEASEVAVVAEQVEPPPGPPAETTGEREDAEPSDADRLRRCRKAASAWTSDCSIS